MTDFVERQLYWSGITETNGVPKTQYEYKCATSSRTPYSCLCDVWVRVKIINANNYFSFAIGHECKVGDASRGVEWVRRNGQYQTATIKNDRKMIYGRDGWSDWVLAFRGTVPMDVDSDEVMIIPCITRPCICKGGSWPYSLNSYEKNNWGGEYGVWHPHVTDNEGYVGWSNGGQDGYVGYYANTPTPANDELAYGNNRYLYPLYSNEDTHIGAYQRIVNAWDVKATPDAIDVVVDSPIKVDWRMPSDAAGAYLMLNLYDENGDVVESSEPIEVGGYEYTIAKPRQIVSAAIQAGYYYTVTVRPFDAFRIESSGSVSSNRILIVEHPTPSTVGDVIVSPTAIDVGEQGTKTVDVSWTQAKDATTDAGMFEPAEYIVVCSMNGSEPIIIERVGASVTSVSINPSEFVQSRIAAGDVFEFGVQTVDAYGYASNVRYGKQVTYYKIDSKLPTAVTITGADGIDGMASFVKQTCTVGYAWWEDGSYPITEYVLTRQSDGHEIHWFANDADKSGSWRYMGVIFPQSNPGDVETYILNAYDSIGERVSDVGVAVQLVRFGGLVYVNIGGAWMPSMIHVMYDGEWRYVYDAYVYDGGEWK